MIGQRFDRAHTRDVRANAEEEVIFSFDYYDGFTPWCTLLAIKGELYGTTAGGGSSYYSGTVFKVSKSGYEVTLRDLPYDFGTPMAGLISLHDWLYGTASRRGAFQVGTSGQAGWSYKVSGSPRGRLTALNGVLYGTAYAGGGNSDGSVFAITTSGQGRILYSFKGAPDGNEPISDLVALNGKLHARQPTREVAAAVRLVRAAAEPYSRWIHLERDAWSTALAAEKMGLNRRAPGLSGTERLTGPLCMVVAVTLAAPSSRSAFRAASASCIASTAERARARRRVELSPETACSTE